MEAVRFDLRWKVALDLPLDHPSHGDVAERPPSMHVTTQRAPAPGRAG
jgi:hypothetical protein